MKRKIIDAKSTTLPKSIDEAVEKIVSGIKSGKIKPGMSGSFQLGDADVCPVHGVKHPTIPMTKSVKARYAKTLDKVGSRKIPGFLLFGEGKKADGGINVEVGVFVNSMSNTEIITTLASSLGISSRGLFNIALEMGERIVDRTVKDNK